jgi:replication factor C subunit 3/5
METTVLSSSSSSSSSSKDEKSDEKKKENLPWVEKYRPEELSDVISHTDIINTIDKLIEKNNLPNLLFYGPPGTGKTSTILACARRVNGPKFQSMVLELNASDERGIEVVRQQIKNFASSQKLFTQGMKLIILDEADAMTQTAQFALRRVMEKYIKSTRFCLICNYINKIIPALQSRCTRFRFGPLEKSQIQNRLRNIASKEGVKLQDWRESDNRSCTRGYEKVY